MAPLLIAAITPDEPGFSALRAESLTQNLNMLGRLAENWQSGINRFNAPGEKLLGAFAFGQLVGVCGLNVDPFSQQPRAGASAIYISASATVGRGSGISCWSRLLPTPAPALIFSTPMRRQRPGRFMKIWDFARSMMNRGSPIACFVRSSCLWLPKRAHVTVQ